MTAARRNGVAERAERRASLQSNLEAVATARLPDLREIWREGLGEEPPALRSREVVRRMLAYRLQEAVHGGLSAAARRKLADIETRRTAPSKTAPRPAIRLGSGAVLIREWKGARHEVHVVSGGYLHEAQTYKSLSEVARAITGTRWNGPLFFGLRDKLNEAA